MTVSNYKSTIGGAFSALGTTLMGIGIIPQLAGTPNKVLLYVAIVGFVCTAIGQFLAHLFAADAKTVRDLSEQVQSNTIDITTAKAAIVTGDTSLINKPKVI
jgi:hypothetical protein